MNALKKCVHFLKNPRSIKNAIYNRLKSWFAEGVKTCEFDNIYGDVQNYIQAKIATSDETD